MSTERRTEERTTADAALPPAWRAGLDLVNDGVLVLALDDGAILDANRGAEQLYGLPREALRGATNDALSERRAPYDQRYALALLDRARAGDPQVFEWRARRGSGAPT